MPRRQKIRRWLNPIEQLTPRPVGTKKQSFSENYPNSTFGQYCILSGHVGQKGDAQWKKCWIRVMQSN
jgi:hypothetical protein